MNKQESIIREAQKLINTPFYSCGRSTLGIDCAGLIILSYRKAKIINNFINDMHYGPFWWRSTKEELLLNGLEANGFVKIDSDPQMADIVTFRLYRRNVPANHCGIMINPFDFISAKCGYKRNERRVCIDSIEPKFTKDNRLNGFYRYKDFLNG